MSILKIKNNKINLVYNFDEFLNYAVVFNKDLDFLFKKFYRRIDPYGSKGWKQLLSEFGERYLNDFIVDFSNFHDSFLSERFEYLYFKTNGFCIDGVTLLKGAYVVLLKFDKDRGYHSPKGYSCKFEESILNYCSAAIYCEQDDSHFWDTNNGGKTWESGFDNKSLQDYDKKKIRNESEWEGGRLCFNEKQDIIYCPICGGHLNSTFF